MFDEAPAATLEEAKNLKYCADTLKYAARINLSDAISQILEVDRTVPKLQTAIPVETTRQLDDLRSEISDIQRRLSYIANSFNVMNYYTSVNSNF